MYLYDWIPLYSIAVLSTFEAITVSRNQKYSTDNFKERAYTLKIIEFLVFSF